MPTPTFQTNRDRLTWLLGEYKLLVSGMILGAFGLVIYYQPQLPTPPAWIAGVLVGWLLLGVPCYLVGAKIARWLRNRNWIEVHHVNAAEDTVQKHYVPPELWREKEIVGPDPYPINGGSAWAVREYEYLDDIEQVRVRGVWLEGCQDTQLMTSKKQMEDIHGWLIDRAEELAAIRGRWSRGAVELQKKLVTAESEANERGQMIQKTAAKDTFGSLVEDGEDFDDAPTIHEIDDHDPTADAAVGDGPTDVSTPDQQTPQMNDD
ncbi:hypothetical protein IL252_15765 [Halomicrobium sp. IBSBa]|uniref:hypothetical protein n=1 Tax=Halomicrobium sp. IBSBa TaxID=2778916 RepID=UPI001ABF4EE1|nr:hypothetical protein [Halomicrobium sp. IBSBa]MBO4249272.1 hypothetical protein [Halomicrobium sp. IBSBa]